MFDFSFWPIFIAVVVTAVIVSIRIGVEVGARAADYVNRRRRVPLPPIIRARPRLVIEGRLMPYPMYNSEGEWPKYLWVTAGDPVFGFESFVPCHEDGRPADEDRLTSAVLKVNKQVRDQQARKVVRQ